EDFIESLIYQTKLSIIKAIYQIKRRKGQPALVKLLKIIVYKAEKFNNDLNMLLRANENKDQKKYMLKKIILSFKNIINQIYVKSYNLKI
ncbi:MAG: hypothetical protein ACPLRN_04080, partial [Microgenomates group bacterium]